MSQRPTVLSIHAVDTAGEEGVLADASVCSELDCRTLGVVTSILVAGSTGVEALQALSLSLVAQQFESVLGRARPSSVRTGIFRDRAQVELVAELLALYRLPLVVVAPVLRVGSVQILDEDTREAVRALLYPKGTVVILRAADLPVLTGLPVEDLDDLKRAAVRIREDGARAVLIVGAFLRDRVFDLLDDEGRVSLFDASRVLAPRVPGLSGAHAIALSAHLARGLALPRAAAAAQRYVAMRLHRGP